MDTQPNEAPSPDAAIAVHPLTPDRWDDLAALFGRVGADGGCWCMYWRLTGAEYARSDRERNRALLRDLVERDRVPGLLAYLDGRPVGWCGLGPRDGFARLQRSRDLKPVDDLPVWSIVCFFVRRADRHRGVARALLRAGVRYAAAHGAPAVEAYPIDLRGSTVGAKAAFPGTVAMLRAAGFREVATTNARSGGAARVIMRCGPT